jgi:outer membrane protein OmpA-like peptidoglycan-associated protein
MRPAAWKDENMIHLEKAVPRSVQVQHDPQETIIILQSEVLFATEHTDLKPAAKRKLDAIARALKGHAEPVLVVAHTDDIGARDRNLSLSRRRAQAVVRYLVARGVRGDRVAARGQGPDEPLAANDSLDGRAQNRRVEIHVNPPKSNTNTKQAESSALPVQSALVVDDDEAIRTALVETLTDAGLSVRSARDGVEALQAMSEDEGLPGVVLLDLMMPRMSGWDVLRAMRQSPRMRALPVIVLTAFDAAEEVPPGTLALHKPFERQLLLDAIQAVGGVCDVS